MSGTARRLLRVVRYLNATRVIGTFIANGGGIEGLCVDCDADHAGDRKPRKSRSGLAVVVSGCVQLSATRSQACVALSSAE